MLGYMLAVLAAATAPTGQTAIDRMGDLATGACWQIESRTVAVPQPSDIDGLDALVEGYGLTPGLSPKAFERMGEGGGMANRATMGSTDVGEDTLVIAFGGQVPGCTVMLLTTAGNSSEYDLVEALATAGWKEVRPGMSQQRGFVGKRMLARRDESGQPYIANVLTIMKPGLDWRHGITIVKVPPHVKLPEGF